jgi:transcriptional regulator with XRE-family HTH domain
MSQQDVANLTGLSRSLVATLERGLVVGIASQKKIEIAMKAALKKAEREAVAARVQLNK